MRALAADDRVEVERMIGVYRGRQRYRFDEVDVFPVEEFMRELFAGRVFRFARRQASGSGVQEKDGTR
jgi:hypothetical protein